MMRAVRLLPVMALAACSSTPSHFYTLLPPPAAPPAAGAAYRIEVQPVQMPEQVATEQMVVRISTGELVPVETRRWIAPLGDEIRGALSADLSQRLGANDTYGLPAGAGGSLPLYRISVKVQRFESSLGAYARIDALWTVQRAGVDSAAGLTCGYSQSQPVQPGYEAMAQGHQQALAAIADRIAATVGALRGGGASCPAG